MLQLRKSIITAFHNSSPRCKEADTDLKPVAGFQWESGVADGAATGPMGLM